MSAHTPGPWRIQIFDECQTAILPDRGNDKRQGLIAIVSVGEGRPDGEGNTRLIAAAPDLLDALQGVLDTLRSTNPDYHQYVNYHTGMEALRKAGVWD